VRIRLILQPAWLRFVAWAFFLAVGWGALTTLESRVEIESNVVSAIFFGVIVAGFFTATSQATHRGAMEALSGLDQTGRSQAIDAVAHGVVPADPDVRASAIRLGRVWLRHKSADQYSRLHADRNGAGVDQSGSLAVGDTGSNQFGDLVDAVRLMGVDAVAGGCRHNVQCG
jgi:hypothetical protein